MSKPKVIEICIYSQVGAHITHSQKFFFAGDYEACISEFNQALIGMTNCALKGLATSEKTIQYHQYINYLKSLLDDVTVLKDEPIFRPIFTELISALFNYSVALENATDYDFYNINKIKELEPTQLDKELVAINTSEIHLSEINFLFELQTNSKNISFGSSRKVMPLATIFEDDSHTTSFVERVIRESAAVKLKDSLYR